jgi:hypothetical protein
VKTLRIAAIAFGVLVIAGEIFRSWGERAIIMWLDDFMVGAALIAAALLLSPETPRRRAIFSAAWAFAVGIIYISFFDKVVLAEAIGPGVEFNRLNIFVTLSLVLAAAGLAASLVIPFSSAS